MTSGPSSDSELPDELRAVPSELDIFKAEISSIKSDLSELTALMESHKKEIIGSYVQLNREIRKQSSLRWSEEFILRKAEAHVPSGKPRVCIINDTRYETGHLGCRLVMENLERAISDAGGDLVFTFRSDSGFSPQLIEEVFGKIDIIIINGEGTCHSNKSPHLYQIAGIGKSMGRKVILANSVWQNNKGNRHALRFFDHVFVRESRSGNEIQSDGIENPEVISDMTFYQELERTSVSDRTDRIVVVDSVVPEVSRGLNQFCQKLDLQYHYMGISSLAAGFPGSRLLSSVETIREATLVITGRFHAVALAINLGIPFVTIASNTHKIVGLLEDARLDPSQHLIRSHPATRDNLQAICARFQGDSLREYRDRTNEYRRQASRKLREFFTEVIS